MPLTVKQINKYKFKSYSDSFDYRPDTLSNELIKDAPINIKAEVALIDRKQRVVNFTRYDNFSTSIMSSSTAFQCKRLPNMLPHLFVEPSSYYCCTICLHPLSLLIPKSMPHNRNVNKIISEFTFQFLLSESAQKLIVRNCVNLVDNKFDYKWQVVLKFISLKTNVSVPSPGQSFAQNFPPYLEVAVNGKIVVLWEIVPSDGLSKEGKRYPKSINIAEKLNLYNGAQNGYPQTVLINWWQTPCVFQYYYMGVYLERRLSISETIELLASNYHINTIPKTDTLKLIKMKFNDNKYNNNDDVIMSPFLPISLSCPIGRTRIKLPIRSINCKHLQCFDARQFLLMNENRCLWRCPVCNNSATFNELFCDKYFQSILLEYHDNEQISEVNVNADGTYAAVLKEMDKQIVVNVDYDIQDTTVVDTLIILDSDEEENVSVEPTLKNSFDTRVTENRIKILSNSKGYLNTENISINQTHVGMINKNNNCLRIISKSRKFQEKSYNESIFQRTEEVKVRCIYPVMSKVVYATIDPSSPSSFTKTSERVQPRFQHINSLVSTSSPPSVPSPFYSPADMNTRIAQNSNHGNILSQFPTNSSVQNPDQMKQHNLLSLPMPLLLSSIMQSQNLSPILIQSPVGHRSHFQRNLTTVPVRCPIVIVNRCAPLTSQEEIVKESATVSLDDERVVEDKKILNNKRSQNHVINRDDHVTLPKMLCSDS